LSALLMAIAIRCKSFKEAQANSTVLVLGVSMLPMLSLFNQEGEKPWHLWVPALAQSTLMGRVLKGEVISPLDLGVPALACVLLAALCLVYISRQLAQAAVR
jgi:sodium transport system permease protein